MSAPSPVNAASDLFSFIVKAGGTAVAGALEILSLRIEHALNRIPSAQIVLRDGDPATESFPAASSATFSPGTKVEILLGYQGINTPVFSGTVFKLAVEDAPGNPALTIVSCRDAAFALTIGRHQTAFAKTTDSAVLARLIGAHGLAADVAATAHVHERLVQFAATDWDFLVARAEANGFVVSVAAGKITVAPPALSAAPVLSLTYGLDLLAFSLEEDAASQLASVAATAWDAPRQTLATATANNTNPNPLGGDSATSLAAIAGSRPLPLVTPTPQTPETLQTWATAQLLKANLAKIRGTLSFQGSALAVPGCTVALAGLGQRFDGNAYVSGVLHEVRDGDWRTTATVGLAATWHTALPDVTARPAAGLLPAAHGLHLGTVKQIAGDPDGNFRVLVTVPTLDPAGDGLWARLASPYAGTNAGVTFFPEIGDEVVLAFLDDDPRYPVVLGSLFSQRHAAPFPPDEKNATKAIVTAGQLKVLFDDAKKSLTLVTPAGNRLVLSDEAKGIVLEDQNGNSLKLTSSGIALKSAAELTLSATGNLSLQTNANLAAKTPANVAISGGTVSLEAATAFAAQGAASARLTSDAMTTIRGALVSIN